MYALKELNNGRYAVIEEASDLVIKDDLLYHQAKYLKNNLKFGNVGFQGFTPPFFCVKMNTSME